VTITVEHARPMPSPLTDGPVRQGRRWMVAAMAVGAMMMAGAVSLITGMEVDQAKGVQDKGSPDSVVVPTFPDVGISAATYGQGHSSGWHRHPGVHSVVVLSGTLTLYDTQCQRQDVTSGESYLGGAEAHLVRNEAPDPVQVVVTYAFATTSTINHAQVVSAPSGCDAR
jgi:quercetin dioxygenase-like cupin family protein